MKYLKAIGIPLAFMSMYLLFGCLLLLITSDSILTMLLANIFISVIGLLYHKHYVISEQKHYTYKGVLAFLSLLLLTALIMQHTTTFIYDTFGDTAFDSYSKISNTKIGLFILLVLVFAPIAEELLMRGIMFKQLSIIMPAPIASMISAIIFALLHGTLLHILPGIYLGNLFAMVYTYTGKLKYAILFHSLYNFSTLFLGNIIFPKYMLSFKYVIPPNIVIVFVLFLFGRFVWYKNNIVSKK